MQRSRLDQEYINALEQYVNTYGKHIQLPENKNNYISYLLIER